MIQETSNWSYGNLERDMDVFVLNMTAQACQTPGWQSDDRGGAGDLVHQLLLHAQKLLRPPTSFDAEEEERT